MLSALWLILGLTSSARCTLTDSSTVSTTTSSPTWFRLAVPMAVPYTEAPLQTATEDTLGHHFLPGHHHSPFQQRVVPVLNRIFREAKDARHGYLTTENDDGQSVSHTGTFIRKLHRSRREDSFPETKDHIQTEGENPVLTDKLATKQRDPVSTGKDSTTEVKDATPRLKSSPQLEPNARVFSSSSSPRRGHLSPKALRTLMAAMKSEAAGDVVAGNEDTERIDDRETERKGRAESYTESEDRKRTDDGETERNGKGESYIGFADVDRRNGEETEAYHFSESEIIENKVLTPLPLVGNANPEPEEIRFLSETGTFEARCLDDKNLSECKSFHENSESSVLDEFRTLQNTSPNAESQALTELVSFHDISSGRPLAEALRASPTIISLEDENLSPGDPRSFHVNSAQPTHEEFRTFRVEGEDQGLRELEFFQENSGSLLPGEFINFQPHSSTDDTTQVLKDSISFRVIKQGGKNSQNSDDSVFDQSVSSGDPQNEELGGFQSIWPNEEISQILTGNNNDYVNSTKPTTVRRSVWTTTGNTRTRLGRTRDNFAYTSYSHALNNNADSSPIPQGMWQARTEDHNEPHGVGDDGEYKNYFDIQTQRMETSMLPWPLRLTRKAGGAVESREAPPITQNPPFEVQLGFSLPVNQTTSLKLINILRFNASLPMLLDPSRPEIIVDLETGVGPSYANDSLGLSLDVISSDSFSKEGLDDAQVPNTTTSDSNDETNNNNLEKLSQAQRKEKVQTNNGQSARKPNSGRQTHSEYYSQTMTTATPENEAQTSTRSGTGEKGTDLQEETEFKFNAAAELADLLGIPISELRHLLRRNPEKIPTLWNPVVKGSSENPVADGKDSAMISTLKQGTPPPQTNGSSQQQRRPFTPPSSGLRVPPHQNNRSLTRPKKNRNNNNNNNNNPQSVNKQKGNGGRNPTRQKSKVTQNVMIEASGLGMDSPQTPPHHPIIPEPKLWSIFYRPQAIEFFREGFPFGREYSAEADRSYRLSSSEAEAIRSLLLANGKMEYMRRMLGMETNYTQLNGNEQEDMMSRMGEIQVADTEGERSEEWDTKVEDESIQSDNLRDKNQGDLVDLGDEDIQDVREPGKDNMEDIVDLLRYLQLMRRYRVGDVNNETASLLFPNRDEEEVEENDESAEILEAPRNSTQLDLKVMDGNEGNVVKQAKEELGTEEPGENIQGKETTGGEEDRTQRLHEIAELIRFLKSEKRKKFRVEGRDEEEIGEREDIKENGDGGDENEQNNSEENIMKEFPRNSLTINPVLNSDDGDQEGYLPENDTVRSVKDLMKTMEKSKFDLVVDFIMSLQKDDDSLREGELSKTPGPRNPGETIAEDVTDKMQDTDRNDQEMAETLEAMSSNVTGMLMKLEGEGSSRSSDEILDAIEELIIRVQNREINRMGEVPDEGGGETGGGGGAMIGGLSVEEWLKKVLERGNRLRGNKQGKRTMRKVADEKEERKGDEGMGSVGRRKTEKEEVSEDPKAKETLQDTEKGTNREMKMEKNRNEVDSCEGDRSGKKTKGSQRDSNGGKSSKMGKQVNVGNGEENGKEEREPDDKMDGEVEEEEKHSYEMSNSSEDKPNENEEDESDQSDAEDPDNKVNDGERERDEDGDKEDEDSQGTNNDKEKNKNGYGGVRHRYEWWNGDRPNERDRGRRERFRGRPPAPPQQLAPQRFGNIVGRRPFGAWLGDPIAIVQAPDLSLRHPAPPGHPVTPPGRPDTSFQRPAIPTKNLQTSFRGPNALNGTNNPIKNIVSSPRDPIPIRRPDPSFRGQAVSTGRPDTSFHGQFPSTRRPSAPLTGSFVSTRRPDTSFRGPEASNEGSVEQLRNTFTSNRGPGAPFRSPHAPFRNPTESPRPSQVIHRPQLGPARNPTSFQRPFQPTRVPDEPNNEHIRTSGRPPIPGTPQPSQIGPDELRSSSYATVPGKPLRFDQFSAPPHESNERPGARPLRSPIIPSETPTTLFRSQVPKTERPLSFFQNPLKFLRMPLLFSVPSMPMEDPPTSFVTKSPVEKPDHKPRGLLSWAI